MKADEIKPELEKYYKDAKNPGEAVDKAMAYVQEKLGVAAESPTETPEPMETVAPEAPQEETSGGSPAGTIILILVLLCAAGGGGYYWYIQKQRKREEAQRMARKKVAQQNRTMAGKDGVRPARPVSSAQDGTRPARTASAAQNGARVRTGTYTEGTGSARPKATPSATSGGQNSGSSYGSASRNPWTR